MLIGCKDSLRRAWQSSNSKCVPIASHAKYLEYLGLVGIYISGIEWVLTSNCRLEPLDEDRVSMQVTQQRMQAQY